MNSGLITLDIIKNKLLNLINIYKGESFIDSSTLEEDIKKLISEINIQKESLNNDELLQLEYEYYDIVSNYEMEIKTEYDEKGKPYFKNIQKVKSDYAQLVTTKFLTDCSNVDTLTRDEAKEIFADYNYVNEKFRVFSEFISWINLKGIPLIPDRIMFSTYMRITVDTYVDFLSFFENEKVQNVFKKAEQFIITLRLNAGETGTRNSSAVKTNVSYDKVGNNLTPKDNSNGKTTNNLIITNEEIFNKMKALGFSGKPKDYIDNDE